MSQLSTYEVAKMLAIDKSTLERWLASGNIVAPKSLHIGQKVFRKWTTADIDRVRRYKKKNYRKGRGRKPKVKR